MGGCVQCRFGKAAFRGRPGGTLAGSLRSPESGYQRLFASTLALIHHVHAWPSGLGQRKGSSAPSSLPTASPPGLPLLHLVYFLISLSQSILWHPPPETLRVLSVFCIQCCLQKAHNSPFPPDRPYFSTHTLQSCSRHAAAAKSL